MKLTVTNKTGQSYGVNALMDGKDTVVELANNETWEGEFADHEATALSRRSDFEVKGYTEPKNAGSNSGDVVADVSQLTKERDDARASLKDIANLFGTPDVDELNVKSAVERLIQDSKPNKPENSDLAAAVKLLDDANDEHWTQAGKPRVSALSRLMDKEVTAADYDALPDDAKRERARS